MRQQQQHRLAPKALPRCVEAPSERVPAAGIRFYLAPADLRDCKGSESEGPQ
jgi:hypothetical protein